MPGRGIHPCRGWTMTPSLQSSACCKPPHLEHPACPRPQAAPGCCVCWHCLLQRHRPVPKGLGQLCPPALWGGQGILPPHAAAGICTPRGGKRHPAASRAPALDTGTLQTLVPPLPRAGTEPGTQHTRAQPPLGTRYGSATAMRAAGAAAGGSQAAPCPAHRRAARGSPLPLSLQMS